jgi:hypothetical protein
MQFVMQFQVCKFSAIRVADVEYWLYACFRHFKFKMRQSLQISLWRIVAYQVIQTIGDIIARNFNKTGKFKFF